MSHNKLFKHQNHCLMKMQEALQQYNHWYQAYMHYNNQMSQQPYLQVNPYTQVNPHLNVSPHTQVNPHLNVSPQTQVNPDVEVSPETQAYLNFDPDLNLNIGNNWK